MEIDRLFYDQNIGRNAKRNSIPLIPKSHICRIKVWYKVGSSLDRFFFPVVLIAGEIVLLVSKSDWRIPS